jgi:hypothetical protein
MLMRSAPGSRGGESPLASAAGAGTAGRDGRTAELENILARLLADGDQHLTSGPASEVDLARLEEVVRAPLPESFRRFLRQLGAGLFYQGHEIFGPCRVMVHDIELVPSLGSVHARLAVEPLAKGLIPFHRFAGHLHLFDRHDPLQPEGIVSIPSGSTYPDLATFLRTAVLP